MYLCNLFITNYFTGMSRYRVTVDDDDDNDTGELVWLSFLITAIITIVGIIAAIFAAFMLVGLVWGTIKSIINYIKGVIDSGYFELRPTIKYAWDANVNDMDLFFMDAQFYGGTMPALIKTFLFTCGIGTIVFGTVTLPVWMLLHICGLPIAYLVRAIQDR